jgi:predicted thioesterase
MAGRIGCGRGYPHTVTYVPGNVGVTAELELTVTDADTAIALRSGEVAVLATPRVVALCEEASIAALAGQLGEKETSVGTRIELAHLAPVMVGSRVRACATLEKMEGRRLVFNVTVSDRSGLVAAGRLTRVVVETRQFMEKAR